jgi:eukaryotic-like serine/threonine-protein kinase
MSTKIGHFEILSELSKSPTGAVYKVDDSETKQTVALKVINLSAFGHSAADLEKSLVQEVEAGKVLSYPNLPPIFGAGEIDGQFCGAMEYIQGNSVATMLANKEGFSIWDLLDIGRQVCGALDHAHSHNIFHYSLEPAKIMCGWDGTVRVLGFGLSSVGKFAPQTTAVPSIFRYMSPEQIQGEPLDARSNVFSLGALFYEMVTDRQAFDSEDAETLCRSIQESTPAPPMQVNPKLHPQLNSLIMKALSKDPGERYQSGKELLDDLEKCKESKPQVAKASAAPAKAPAAPPAAKPRSVAADPPKPAPQPPVQKNALSPPPTKPVVKPERAKAAAVGWGDADSKSTATSTSSRAATNAPPPQDSMSWASGTEMPAEPGAEIPKIAIDPMMGEDGGSRSRVSFSELTELPPLKEIYIAPPPPRAPEAAPQVFRESDEAETPKVQAREAAQRAIKEIKNVPPRLLLYAIAGAAVLILIIAIALVMHVNRLNSDDDSPRPEAANTASQPAAAEPSTQPGTIIQDRPSSAVTVTEVPSRAVSRNRNSKKKEAAAPATPVAVPGQMAIDSTPQGAQIQIDGKTDPSWITPVTLSGLDPGQHSISVSKPGYSSDTRTVEVASGSKSFVVTHLTQLMATLSVTSTPPGANVYIDGKDSGKLTPAQISVDKGQHIVLVRKQGYLDENTSQQFVLAQTTTFSPALRSLGNVDDIRTVNKMKRFFGGKEAAGLATMAVKTQPKGAQVAVNQHVLDKMSPVEVALDPGNYEIDITLTGYAPIHKIITVDKGGKAVVDEVMQKQ